MSYALTESDIEQTSLPWLESAGWQVAHGLGIAPAVPAAERADYGELVLARRPGDLPASGLPEGRR